MILSEVITKVGTDLDLFNNESYGDRAIDPMISRDEIVGYVCDSLEEVEAIIHSKYEDYFMTSYTFALVAGQSVYDLPTDIHIKKIRRAWVHSNIDPFNPSGSRYKMRRIINVDHTFMMGSGSTHAYMLYDSYDSLSGTYTTQIRLFPNVTTEYNVTIWYLRKLVKPVLDSDNIDVEFPRYLVEDVKYKCLIKEPGNPLLQDIKTRRDDLRGLMEQCLSNKIPDDQNGEVELDMSIYDDFVGGY